MKAGARFGCHSRTVIHNNQRHCDSALTLHRDGSLDALKSYTIRDKHAFWFQIRAAPSRFTEKGKEGDWTEAPDASRPRPLAKSCIRHPVVHFMAPT